MTVNHTKSRNQSSAFAAFCFYTLGVFLIGALIAYPFYLLIDVLGGDIPFYKVVHRSQKLMALLLLVPLLLYLRNHHRCSWGVPASYIHWAKEISIGLLIGGLTLGFIVVILFGLRVRVFHEPIVLAEFNFILLICNALIAGLVIGHIEELWFRGGLFAATRAFLGAFETILLTAVIYAIVHFIRFDEGFKYGAVEWYSGLLVTQMSFSQFTNPEIVDSLFALFVAGIFLALVRNRTGSIGLCIGIHAGWVAVIKLTRKISTVDWSNDWVFLIGRYDGVIGELAILTFGLSVLVYYFQKKPAK